MTRGERNANPGNIRRLPGVTWQGEATDQSGDASFVVFTTPLYGIRAIARVMLSYQREGLRTIQEVIDRWAPPNENNSQAYVAAVCQGCQKGPSDLIDFDADMPALVKSIIVHENGECIYTDEQISTGIALA